MDDLRNWGRAYGKGVMPLTIAVSAYLAFCAVSTPKTAVTYTWADIFPKNFIGTYTWLDALYFFVLTAGLSCLFLAIARAFAARRKAASFPVCAQGLGAGRRDQGFRAYARCHRRHIIALFIFIFLCWAFVLVVYYPASSMNDQLVIIDDPIAASVTHPPIYCLALSGIVRAARQYLGSGNLGVVCFAVIQMALCAGIVVYVLCWLERRGVGKGVIWVVAAVFALTPVVQDYASCIIKDTLFSFSFLLWIPLLFDLAAQRDRFFAAPVHLVELAVLSVFTGTMRNNGVYVVAVLLIVVVCLSRHAPHMRRVVFTSVLALALAVAPSAVFSQVSGLKGSFAETVGIPLQQMAAAACLGQKGDAQSSEVVDTLFDPDLVAQGYAPMFVDTLKFNSKVMAFNGAYLDENRAAFFKAWADVGIRYPDTYLRAWLSATYGCWTLAAVQDPGQSYFFGLSSNASVGQYRSWLEKGGQIEGVIDNPGERAYIIKMLTIEETYHVQNQTFFSEEVDVALRALFVSLVWSPGNGVLFALLLVLGLLVCYRHGPRYALMVMLPFVLLWGTLMLSAPLSTALRYAFAFLVAIPVFAALLAIPAIQPMQASDNQNVPCAVV